MTQYGQRIAKAINQALADSANEFPMVLDKRTVILVEHPKEGLEHQGYTLEINTLDSFIEVHVSLEITEIPKGLKEKK